jgi:flavorubredoxin
MKAIILFDTLFGNTEKIALSLAKGLQQTEIESEWTNIALARIDKLSEYDLLVLGAPTQYITASKPMKEFLDRLKDAKLKGKFGFAFDTKLGFPLSGSAAKFIEKKLKTLGLEIIQPRSSAIVITTKEKKGHGRPSDVLLREGTVEQFEKVGKDLGAFLHYRMHH